MAGNGMDALEDLKFIQPDIVIVDLLMPVMDGIHFVRKAKELYPDITYVMLSQVSSKEMVAQAYECRGHLLSAEAGQRRGGGAGAGQCG